MLFYIVCRIAIAFLAYGSLAFLLAIGWSLAPDTAKTAAQLFSAIATGQFGQSAATARPVAELVFPAVGSTIATAFLAALVSAVLAIPLGILAAQSRSRVADTAWLRLALIPEAVPVYWLALLLFIILAVQLRLVPATSQGGGPGLIPVIAVAAAVFPVLMRRTRQGVAELMGSPGGAGGGVILVTCLSALLAAVVSGLGPAVIVDNIVAGRGGRLLFDAVARRDAAVLAGAIMTIGTAAIAIAWLSDVLRAAAGAGGHRLGFSHELAHYGETPGLPRFASIGFVAGAVILVAAMGLSLIGGDPNSINVAARSTPVGSQGHPLGTDGLGRDVLARLSVAVSWSIGFGFLAAAVATVLGAILGTIGTLSSITTTLVRIGTEARFSLPLLFMAIGAASAFQPGLLPLAAVIGVGLFDGPSAATLAARYRLPVQALYHQPPPPSFSLAALTGPWLATFLHSAASAIILFEAMNFAGLGLPPPNATFGEMLASGAQFSVANGPAQIIIIGLVLAMLVMALLLMADGVRAAIGRQRR